VRFKVPYYFLDLPRLFQVRFPMYRAQITTLGHLCTITDISKTS